MFEYLFGYAPKDRPGKVSFYDPDVAQLFRDVDLGTLGAHGWELVSVLPGVNETGEKRYEYWLKRHLDNRPSGDVSE